MTQRHKDQPPACLLHARDGTRYLARSAKLPKGLYIIMFVLWLYFSDKEAFGGLLLSPPCDVM